MQDEIRSAGMYRELWQSFCMLQVNRVTLDITSKPPGTIEWE